MKRSKTNTQDRGNSRNNTKRDTRQRGSKDGARTVDRKQSDGTAEVVKVSQPDRTNDPSWYAKNPQLMTAAGSFSFANVLGTSIPYATMGSVPGIMSINYAPSLGTADPTIIAARNVYSYVRHANSGSANYDAPDLMMYILACDSAFSYIALLQRVYGVMNLYNQKNKYYPRALVRAMGFDFDSLLANLANLNYYINALVARASVLWIPSTMPVVERHFWLNSMIFTDGESAKSQTYVFVPTGFWKYNATKSVQGGGLDVVAWNPGTTAHNFGDIQRIGEEIFSQLDANNEDFGIMGGDILKAYGKENLYTLNEVPFGYTILPTYSKEVLTQIHNSSAVAVPMRGVSQDVQGNIRMDSYSTTTYPGPVAELPLYQILDFHQVEPPTPEQVMVATRLKPGTPWITTVEVEGSPTRYQADVDIVGTEYPVNYCIWYYNNDSLEKIVFNSCAIDTKAGFNPTQLLAYYAAFDWAPMLYAVDGSSVKTSYYYGDVEQYTFIEKESLKKLHTTATWSEFGIPTM